MFCQGHCGRSNTSSASLSSCAHGTSSLHRDMLERCNTSESNAESKANVWLTSFHSFTNSSYQDVSQQPPGDLEARTTIFTAHGVRSVPYRIESLKVFEFCIDVLCRHASLSTAPSLRQRHCNLEEPLCFFWQTSVTRETVLQVHPN